jgi:hypothetical protein
MARAPFWRPVGRDVFGPGRGPGIPTARSRLVDARFRPAVRARRGLQRRATRMLPRRRAQGKLARSSTRVVQCPCTAATAIPPSFSATSAHLQVGTRCSQKKLYMYQHRHTVLRSSTTAGGEMEASGHRRVSDGCFALLSLVMIGIILVVAALVSTAVRTRPKHF